MLSSEDVESQYLMQFDQGTQLNLLIGLNELLSFLCQIAIMGCIVNGPGEMADADFGYVGGAPGKIDLYVGKVLTLIHSTEMLFKKNCILYKMLSYI